MTGAFVTRPHHLFVVCVYAKNKMQVRQEEGGSHAKCKSRLRVETNKKKSVYERSRGAGVTRGRSGSGSGGKIR